jgi:kynurenine formamidase
MNIIDLTLQVEDGMSTFPGMQKVVLLPSVTHAFSAARYAAPCKGYASFQLILNDHTGTHIDSPFHMCEEKETIEKLPLSSFIGDAILLDFSEMSPDREITRKDIEEKLSNTALTIKEKDIVIIKKWRGRWGEEGFFKCKALDESAAAFLVERKIKLLGIDLPSVDVEDPPMRRRAHIKLLSNDIYIVENLINLEKIPKSRFRFMAMPLNIKGITGSPTRAIAIIE